MFSLRNFAKLRRVKGYIMKYLSDITLAYVFVLVLMLPVIVVLFNTYGFLTALFFVLLPLLWFVMDSDVSHHEVDKYLL